MSAGKQFSFYVPAVGECYDVRPVEKAAPIYLRLDCSLPHQNEVFATFDYTDTKEYPGSQVLEAQAKQRCPPSWEAYVGKPYETSRLALDFNLPDQGGWGNGIRHVVGCLVVDPATERRVGSVRGSGEWELSGGCAASPGPAGADLLAGELGRAPLAEGGQALGQIGAGPRPLEGLAVGGLQPEPPPSRPSASLSPTLNPARVSGASSVMASAQARASSRSAEPLHQAEVERLRPGVGLGRQAHGPGRALPGEQGEPLHRPLVGHEPELAGGDAEDRVGRWRPAGRTPRPAGFPRPARRRRRRPAQGNGAVRSPSSSRCSASMKASSSTVVRSAPAQK